MIRQWFRELLRRGWHTSTGNSVWDVLFGLADTECAYVPRPSGRHRQIQDRYSYVSAGRAPWSLEWRVPNTRAFWEERSVWIGRMAH
jgi:hypothetical protein